MKLIWAAVNTAQLCILLLFLALVYTGAGVWKAKLSMLLLHQANPTITKTTSLPVRSSRLFANELQQNSNKSIITKGNNHLTGKRAKTKKIFIKRSETENNWTFKTQNKTKKIPPNNRYDTKDEHNTENGIQFVKNKAPQHFAADHKHLINDETSHINLASKYNGRKVKSGEMYNNINQKLQFVKNKARKHFTAEHYDNKHLSNDQNNHINLATKNNGRIVKPGEMYNNINKKLQFVKSKARKHFTTEHKNKKHWSHDGQHHIYLSSKNNGRKVKAQEIYNNINKKLQFVKNEAAKHFTAEHKDKKHLSNEKRNNINLATKNNVRKMKVEKMYNNIKKKLLDKTLMKGKKASYQKDHSEIISHTKYSDKNDGEVWKGVLTSNFVIPASPAEKNLLLQKSVLLSNVIKPAYIKQIKRITNATFTGEHNKKFKFKKWEPVLSINTLKDLCKQTIKLAGNTTDNDQIMNKLSENKSCSSYFTEAMLPNYVMSNFIGACSGFSSYNITLVLQMDVKAPNFVKLKQNLDNWEGPVSLALYFTYDLRDYYKLMDWISKEFRLHMERLCVHIVIGSKSDNFFPINMLRNVGVKYAQTDLVLVSEADFIVPPNVVKQITHHTLHSSLPPRVALIIPAFANEIEDFSVPHNRSELLEQWRLNITVPVHDLRNWKKGHDPTNYQQLKNTTANYEVKYQNYFEPYYVMDRTQVPYYPEEVAFGVQDKAAHAQLLSKIGFKFVVMYDTFMVHTYHINRAGRWDIINNFIACKHLALDGLKKDVRNFSKLQKRKRFKVSKNKRPKMLW